MNWFQKHFLSFLLAFILLLIVQAILTYGQSEALDAQIEGIVTDTNGSIIPSAAVTAVNLETGTKRSSASNEKGIFRFPLLSLGSYAVRAEVSGFKRYERRGIRLAAGQTVSVSLVLEPGRLEEIVTVTADAAIGDESKFEIGRTVNSKEVKNLPLVSLNPYNFALLQPGVNGRSVGDPSAVELNANGLLRRVGYQFDGGYNNDADLGGFRLNILSVVFIKEVQLLSSGYSAEFGNTAGAIVNVITPSGTNDLVGTLGLLYRPAPLASKPFGFTRGDPEPNLNSYDFTATVGGPIVKDRWHFYAGYERARRTWRNPISVADANRRALVAVGLPESIFVDRKGIVDHLPFFIFRTDSKISGTTRVSFRYNRFDAGLTGTGVGGLNTTHRSFDLGGWDHAFATQAITSFSETFFNEFRFQYAKRITRVEANEDSATGLTVTINRVARFGPSPRVGNIDPNQSTTQFQDAITKVFQMHSVKLGGGINFIYYHPTNSLTTAYIFPTLQSYLDAVSGVNRRGYEEYDETFGDNEISYGSIFLNLFIQDEWKVSRRLKLSGGLRYDLYRPPKADPTSPLPFSKKFTADKNNLGPRLGASYLLREGKYPTVVRAGTGAYYDPPFLYMYRRAILNNGNPRFFSFTFSPGDDNHAPDFPNTLGSFPPGEVLPRQNIDAVAPDFETMYAIHSNLQVEQAITNDMSLTVGYLHSIARHIPVYRNINCLPVGGTLADGCPLYGTIKPESDGSVTAMPCTNRIYPAFNNIMMVESAGNLNYDGLFLQLAKRFANGYQIGASYTLSHSRDDAPEDNAPGRSTVSDPSNRARDRGDSFSNILHTLTISMVARPNFSFPSPFLRRFLSGNQIGLIAQADSGENFSFTTGDINLDGVVGSDRPVGVARNSGRIPPFFNVDLRFSRFAKLRGNLTLELFAEAANVFNGKYVSFYDNTTLSSNDISTSEVNPLTGELRGSLPDLRSLPVNWRDSRQLQLGLKFHF